VLAVYPFCDLVRNYWVLCRRVYNAFLVVHVLFMTLFTVYAMPSTAFLAARFHLQPVDNSTPPAADESFRRDTVPLYGLFLLWPVAVMLLELLDVVEFCYRACCEESRRRRDAAGDDAADEEPTSMMRRLRKVLALGNVILFGFNYMSNISALTFGSSVIAWLAPPTVFKREM